MIMIALDYALRLSLDKINDKGLTIQPRRSSRYPSKHLTDLDFADDIALLADCLENAQHMLTSLQEAAALVGLHLNEGKTEYITNCSGNTIKAQNGSDIKQVEDFKYLGAWVMDSGKEFTTRKDGACMVLKPPQYDQNQTLPSNNPTNLTLRKRNLDTLIQTTKTS